jgi:hypothetical protein
MASLKPIYAFFAPADGFAEAVVLVSLTAAIVLAFLSKLTDSYAATLTALNIGAIAHDNLTTYFESKRKENAIQKP